MRGNNDYFGPLYIGTFYREQRMIYDTASHSLSIDDINSRNAQLVSNYDVKESETANNVCTNDDAR